MQSKYWCITDNLNHGKEGWMPWVDMCAEEIAYFVIKLERAPVTGHLHGQGFLALKQRKRLSQVKGMLLGGVHIEMMRGTVRQSVDYVKKSATTVPVQDGGWMVEFGEEPDSEQGKRSDLELIRDLVKQGKDEVEIVDVVPQALRYLREIRSYRALLDEKQPHRLDQEIELRLWQKRLFMSLANFVKSRRIYWIWSEFSEVGKTTTMNYIAAKKLMTILPANEKLNDVLYAYNRQQIIWFNLPRSELVTTGVLSALESLSDGGLVFSGKYDSRSKWVSSHIVVTANVPPPFQQLPKRIEEWKIDSFGELVELGTPPLGLDRIIYLENDRILASDYIPPC